MQQRTKILVAFIAIIALAIIILSSSRPPAQAQTPNLFVAGAIYGGTINANSTPGPVPVCYTLAGAACAGSLHVVVGATTAPVTAPCNANSTCDLNGTTSSYVTVPLTGAAQFSNATFTCSASIFTLPPSANGYVGYCQPDDNAHMFIYMYNPGPTIPSTASVTVTITYTASGS
jgi:hypothetical protein